MSFIEGMFRFQFELSLVEKNFYETVSCKIAKHPEESLQTLAAKALGYVMEQPKTLQWSGDLLSLHESILYERNYSSQLKFVLEIGCPPEKRVFQYARNRTIEEVVIYFLDQAELNKFLSYLKGSETNWVQKFRIHLLDSDLLNFMADQIQTSTYFSILLNDGLLYLSLTKDTTQTLECTAPWIELDIWSEYQRYLVIAQKEENSSELQKL